MFCEGTKTEPEYLEALRKEPAVRDVAAVEIRIEMGASGAVPLTLVREATEVRARNPHDHGDVDEVWCLFDVEWPQNHPNLDEAIDQATKRDVCLAISNPCFELWLALHFGDYTAWLNTSAATKLRRERDGSSGKGLDAAAYMSRRSHAAQRARSLASKHVGDGTDFPHDNPSSGMYRFLDAIQAE